MIHENNIKRHIEESNYFKALTGTDKFKQLLILKRSREIFHNYDLAKRQGIEYIKQFVSPPDVKLIEELLLKNE